MLLLSWKQLLRIRGFQCTHPQSSCSILKKIHQTKALFFCRIVIELNIRWWFRFFLFCPIVLLCFCYVMFSARSAYPAVRGGTCTEHTSVPFLSPFPSLPTRPLSLDRLLIWDRSASIIYILFFLFICNLGFCVRETVQYLSLCA